MKVFGLLILLVISAMLKAAAPRDEVVYHFPSPSEVMFYIKNSKLAYKPGFSNLPSNIDKYIERNKQAVNLGVYMSDFAYNSVFNETNIGLQYLTSMQSLGYKLRIDFKMGKNLATVFSNKRLTTDSLIYYADMIFGNIMNYCDQNNQYDVFALITLGGYIECLYLTINYVGTYSENNQLIIKIAEQKFLFDNFSRYLETIEKKIPAAYMNDVTRLKSFYAKLPIIQQKVKVTKVNGKMVVTGGTRYQLSEPQFNELKAITTEIRAKYIGTEY